MFVFFASLILIIPLVLQEKLVCVFAYFLLFLILAFIRKKKVKILPSIFMISSITLFSLFLPFGKILFTFGKIQITEGALILGLKKSFVLCGMVFLSQFATSFVVEIPGKIGLLISNIFYYFNQFSNVEIKKGQVLQKVDNALCELYFTEEKTVPSNIDLSEISSVKENTKSQKNIKSIKNEKNWLFVVIVVDVLCFLTLL